MKNYKSVSGVLLIILMVTGVILSLATYTSTPVQASEHSQSAGAEPNPQRIYIQGPLLWHSGLLECPEVSSETLIVDAYIEELWATQLDVFNTGFSDANNGTHMVQPARWTMSVNTLDYHYTWYGQVTAKAVLNAPSQTAGGLLHYNVRAKLYSEFGGPDLHLEQLFQFVVTANGDLKIFNDSFELTCI